MRCICVVHKNGNVYYIVSYQTHEGLHAVLANNKKAVGTILLLTILASAAIPVSFGMQSSSSISTSGMISYLPHVDITVNANNVIGVNNLSLGFQLDYEQYTWRDRPVMRQLAADANFRLVRIHSIRIEPCTSWSESTKTGTFSWGEVDSLFQRIFEVGAEPLIDLGYASSSGLANLPAGMATNASTGLPYPDSWAAYCKEWVKHFEQTGKPVRFYEIINEAWAYFGWADYTKIGYFKALFNAAAQAMREENPNILLGFDASNRRPILDYWLANGGADLDFISFHKYDSGTIGHYTDEEMFVRAETHYIETDPSYYGIKDAQLVYRNARGKLIPVITSEFNFDSASATGTDPKIQQMVGAVWTALVLRAGILEGLNYSIYYDFTSSKSWNSQKASGGWGFGMVNKDDNQPWYPYYVQLMTGSRLNVGDSIVESVSSSDDVRVLSWVREGKLNILLVCRVDQPQTVYLSGISTLLNITKIDNAISYQTPSLQTAVFNPADPLVLNGYTVMVLQS